MSNIRIFYEYRDDTNCRRESWAIFPNAASISELAVTKILEAHCFNRNLVIAHQVGLPELFHWKAGREYEVNMNDHCWHKITLVTSTNMNPTEEQDIVHFMNRVGAASRDGWEYFCPWLEHEKAEKQANLLAAVKHMLLNMCDRSEHRYLEEEDNTGEPTHEFAYLLVAYAEAGGNLRQGSDTEDWPQWTLELLKDCIHSLEKGGN